MTGKLRFDVLINLLSGNFQVGEGILDREDPSQREFQGCDTDQRSGDCERGFGKSSLRDGIHPESGWQRLSVVIQEKCGGRFGQEIVYTTARKTSYSARFGLAQDGSNRAPQA